MTNGIEEAAAKMALGQSYGLRGNMSGQRDPFNLQELAELAESAQSRIGVKPEAPKLRERLYEIEKLLSDSTVSIRDSADRLFGPMMVEAVGLQAGEVPSTLEPSIAVVVDRILRLTRDNRDEAARFNRIG